MIVSYYPPRGMIMKVVKLKQIFIINFTGIVLVAKDHRKVCKPSHCKEISCPCNLCIALLLLKCMFTVTIYYTMLKLACCKHEKAHFFRQNFRLQSLYYTCYQVSGKKNVFLSAYLRLNLWTRNTLMLLMSLRMHLINWLTMR